ncbi:unnamed protein product [Larinioides sclopetarius]|uniref:Uncharacterized protein n=1 Tax=Larinioides sclopetarius TaxID=280406 RepID=A0AAV1ZGN6_9ARAC
MGTCIPLVSTSLLCNAIGSSPAVELSSLERYYYLGMYGNALLMESLTISGWRQNLRSQFYWNQVSPLGEKIENFHEKSM